MQNFVSAYIRLSNKKSKKIKIPNQINIDSLYKFIALNLNQNQQNIIIATKGIVLKKLNTFGISQNLPQDKNISKNTFQGKNQIKYQIKSQIKVTQYQIFHVIKELQQEKTKGNQVINTVTRLKVKILARNNSRQFVHHRRSKVSCEDSERNLQNKKLDKHKQKTFKPKQSHEKELIKQNKTCFQHREHVSQNLINQSYFNLAPSRQPSRRPSTLTRVKYGQQLQQNPVLLNINQTIQSIPSLQITVEQFVKDHIMKIQINKSKVGNIITLDQPNNYNLSNSDQSNSHSVNNYHNNANIYTSKIISNKNQQQINTNCISFYKLIQSLTQRYGSSKIYIIYLGMILYETNQQSYRQHGSPYRNSFKQNQTDKLNHPQTLKHLLIQNNAQIIVLIEVKIQNVDVINVVTKKFPNMYNMQKQKIEQIENRETEEQGIKGSTVDLIEERSENVMERVEEGLQNLDKIDKIDNNVIKKIQKQQENYQYKHNPNRQSQQLQDHEDNSIQSLNSCNNIQRLEHKKIQVISQQQKIEEQKIQQLRQQGKKLIQLRYYHQGIQLYERYIQYWYQKQKQHLNNKKQHKKQHQQQHQLIKQSMKQSKLLNESNQNERQKEQQALFKKNHKQQFKLNQSIPQYNQQNHQCNKQNYQQNNQQLYQKSSNSQSSLTNQGQKLYSDSIIKQQSNIKEYSQSIKQYCENHHRQVNIKIADIYNQIGMIYNKTKDYSRAIQYFQQSLKIRYHLFGQKSTPYADSLNNIGSALCKNKQYLKALEYLEKSLDIRQKLTGKQSIDSANSYYNLSFVYIKLNYFKSATQYVARAYKIHYNFLGKQHQLTKVIFKRLKKLQIKSNRVNFLKVK